MSCEVSNFWPAVYILIISGSCIDILPAGGIARGTDGQSIDASDAAGEEDRRAADANKAAERGPSTEPDLPRETISGTPPSRLPRGLG